MKSEFNGDGKGLLGNLLQEFRLVLVQPMYGGNVGSIARLTTNYGLQEVYIADTRCDWKNDEAKLYARGHSLERLLSFNEVGTLHEAQSDCAFSVGFSRRRGDLRNPNITLDEIFELSTKGKTALVFGCEESGLATEHLLRCTHICSLPTADIMPSLNLSQAVAVVLSRMFQLSYEEFQKTESQGAKVPAAHFTPGGQRIYKQLSKTMDKLLSPLSLANLEVLITHFRDVMVSSGLTIQGNPDRMLADVRKILQRAALDEREANILHGILSAVERTIRRSE